MDDIIITAIEEISTILITDLDNDDVTIDDVSPIITVGDAAPSNPTSGDIWIDTSFSN